MLALELVSIRGPAASRSTSIADWPILLLLLRALVFAPPPLLLFTTTPGPLSGAHILVGRAAPGRGYLEALLGKRKEQ